MFRQLPLLATQIPLDGLGRPEEVVIGTILKVPHVGFEPKTFGFIIQAILCTADLTTRPRIHRYLQGPKIHQIGPTYTTSPK